MSRALIRLALLPSAPPVVQPRRDLALLTHFGRWLREECATLSRRWPTARLDQLQLRPGELVVLAHFGGAAPPLVSALALSGWLQREIASAAQRSGWIVGEARLWGAQEVVVMVPGEVRCALAATAPVPAAGRCRSSTTPPVRER